MTFFEAIYNCPYCKSKFSKFTGTSGFLLGIPKLYSDGKTINLGLLKNSYIVKCNFCKSCLFLNELNIEQFIDCDEFREISTNFTTCSALKIKDYVNFLKSKELSIENTYELRLNLFLSFNDRVRNNKKKFKTEKYKKYWEDNLILFLPMIESESSLLKAEVLRSLGKFESSIAVAEEVLTGDQKNQYINMCKDKNTEVFMFA